MKFSDFVSFDAIKPNLVSVKKQGVIRELIESLVLAGEIENAEQENVIQRILEREEFGTTGIGRGVAVPHAKHAGVARTVGTVGVSTDGIAFDSLDGAPVNVVFLLVSPAEQSERHLKVLEKISRHPKDVTFRRFLTQSKTVEDIRQVLVDVEEK